MHSWKVTPILQCMKNVMENCHISQHRRLNIIAAFGEKCGLNRMQALLFGMHIPNKMLHSSLVKSSQVYDKLLCFVLGNISDCEAADVQIYNLLCKQVLLFSDEKLKPRHGSGGKN